MKKIDILFLCLIAVLIFPPITHAYLDPGTGSYIIQILLSIILGSLFAFKLFFTKIKVGLKKLFSRNKKNNNKNESNPR